MLLPLVFAALLTGSGLFGLPDQESWQVVAVLQVRRTVLNTFPEDAFVSWPPELRTPNPPPRVTQGMG